MKNRRVISRYLAWALGLVTVLAFSAKSASADTLLVSQSGVWGLLVPTTAETAPDASWSFSFNVDSNPAVSFVSLGASFNPAITNVEYLLNGVPVPGAIGSVTFFSGVELGLIDVNFADGSVLDDFGAQAYSGPESSPTILLGIYPLASGSALFYGTGANTLVNGDLKITPEPASLVLLGSGLLCLGGLIKRNSRN